MIIGNGYGKANDESNPIFTQLTGSNVKLLDNGTSTPQQVGTNKKYFFEAWSTAAFSVKIQAIGPSGNATDLPKVWDEVNGSFVTGGVITSNGFYSIDVPPFTTIQAIQISGTASVQGGLGQ